MSFVDTGIEMFSPEAVDDHARGAENAERLGKAAARGLVSQGADLMNLGDALQDPATKTAKFLGKSLLPSWLKGKEAEGIAKSVSNAVASTELGKATSQARPFNAIEKKLRQFYNSLIEQKLSESEAQNVMEDLAEQIGVHFDDFGAGLAKGAARKALGLGGAALNPDVWQSASGQISNLEDLQKSRGQDPDVQTEEQRIAKGKWVEKAPGIRTFEGGGNHKNVPKPHDPITL